MRSIRTMSIVAGSLACNARCPFCIAGMTPGNGVTTKLAEVNWRNFRKACRFARDKGCSTVMITSKGEPTLYPEQITDYLKAMEPYEFPIIEMQTNGLLIADGKVVTDEHLKTWYDLGLTTMAISVVHYDTQKNREIYVPHKKQYIDLPALVKKLVEHKYCVRLTTIMAKGFLDCPKEVEKMIEFARTVGARQLTLTPVTKPNRSESEEIYQWTDEHHLDAATVNAITTWVQMNGTLIQSMNHGARVFDVHGQNVCLSNCITVDPDADETRSIIFFPDGHVYYAWQYSGAILF